MGIVGQGVEYGVEALELGLPKGAILAKPVPELRHCVRLQASGTRGAVDTGLDQACVFQHLEVAADRGLRDGERTGEVLNRGFAFREPSKDRTAGRVG